MDNRKSFYYPWTQLRKRKIARKRHDHLSASALTRLFYLLILLKLSRSVFQTKRKEMSFILFLKAVVRV